MKQEALAESVCSKFEQSAKYQGAVKIYEHMLRLPLESRAVVLPGLFKYLESELTDEERRRFRYGKRGEIFKSLWATENRSNAYELQMAGELEVILNSLGLVETRGGHLRDALTGQRIRTRLRELARLKWDWSSDQSQAWLKCNWRAAVEMPLDKLKSYVRSVNPNAKGRDV